MLVGDVVFPGVRFALGAPYQHLSNFLQQPGSLVRTRLFFTQSLAFGSHLASRSLHDLHYTLLTTIHSSATTNSRSLRTEK